MKKIFYLILPLLFSITVQGQQPNADFEILNCSPITGNYFFAANTEVSNFQYLEFLSFQRKKISDQEYSKLIPDSTKWRDTYSFNEAYASAYFRHPAYRDYPVVNVSKFQAEAFCTWLTGILNQHYQRNEKHPVSEVLVRLPTEKEWMKAARGGDENSIFPWKGKSMRMKERKFEGQMRASFVRGRGDYMGVAGNLNDNSDITAPIDSYVSNAYGLRNMAGNVSEMVQEPNITKGGSWRSQAMNLLIDTSESYDGKARNDVGFRYFVEIQSFKEVEPKKPIVLNAKYIESLLHYVPSGYTDDSVSVQAFMMSETEITNELYEKFMEEFPKYKPDSKLWSEYVRYSSRLVNDYATNSIYASHPVVNVSHESAIAFCGWLTKKYESFEKRKYKDLKFRLPLEKEWIRAAQGGVKYAIYPWGGPYLRNSKGCFLANHSALPEFYIDQNNRSFVKSGVSSEDIYSVSNLDGKYLTAEVDSYNPNGWGMYCLAGNVAEMISKKGIVKGGSWHSFSPQLQINEKEDCSGPTPFIGFRIVSTFLRQVND